MKFQKTCFPPKQNIENLIQQRERERELFIQEGNRTPVAKATHSRYRYNDDVQTCNDDVDIPYTGPQFSGPGVFGDDLGDLEDAL